MYGINAREVQPEHGGFTWGLGLASAIVGSIVLLLRIWSRIINRSQSFGGDDWMAVAAYPFVVGQALSIMFSFRWGVGLHLSQLNDEEYTKANQLTLVILIMYCFNIAFIRISLSLYYRRVFGSSKVFKRFVWANITVNLVWLISILFAAVFQCTDPRALWDLNLTNVKCTPPLEHQHVCSFSSVVLDLLALLLPLPMIWKLQLGKAKKWEVMSIFILGYCVPILTLGRLISTMLTSTKLNEDPPWYFVNILYWLLLETTTAYVGVCMPSVLFLLRRWQKGGFRAMVSRQIIFKSDIVHSGPTGYGRDTGNGRLIPGGRISQKGAFNTVDSNGSHSYSVTDSKGWDEDAGVMAPEKAAHRGGIMQTRTYTVTRDDEEWV